jgi:membrane protein
MKSSRMLGGMTWTQLGKRLWDDDCEVFARAAQLSYYFLLALIPLLIFLTSAMGMIMGPETHMHRNLFGYLARVMPPTAFKLITTTMHDIHMSGGGGKLYFGLLAALWAASSGMGAITSALNAAYNVRETRPWWLTRLIAIGLTLLLTLLILTALILVLFGGRISDSIKVRFDLGAWFDYLWRIGQWPVVLGFVLLSFALVYYCAPNQRRRKWRWLSPGAVIGASLWLAVSFGLRLYLHFYDSYSVTYGSLGAVIILMLWLYLTGAVVMIGGKINSEVENAAESRT